MSTEKDPKGFIGAFIETGSFSAKMFLTKATPKNLSGL